MHLASRWKGSQKKKKGRGGSQFFLNKWPSFLGIASKEKLTKGYVPPFYGQKALKKKKKKRGKGEGGGVRDLNIGRNFAISPLLRRKKGKGRRGGGEGRRKLIVILRNVCACICTTSKGGGIERQKRGEKRGGKGRGVEVRPRCRLVLMRRT